ncbi:MAG: SUMF1/EgtB/PvdO family nonheme iron enzyme [Gemmatimonadaceae bacterium]|nr:SUMF1/EgtB/PvdO family nonheme iron enzyme [Gemmatimonadaceae bacterium]
MCSWPRWIVAVVLVASCSGTKEAAVQPEPAVLTTVNVSIQPLTIETMKTAQAVASGMDQFNRPVAGAPPTVWSTGREDIATVSSDGIVTGVSPGQTEITASMNNRFGRVTITVIQPPIATVTVSPALAELPLGVTQQVTATLKHADGRILTDRQVTWNSSAPDVATVSPAGIIMAVSAGTATIVATSESRFGSASVTVSANPLGVGFGREQFTLIPSGTFVMGVDSLLYEAPAHQVTLSKPFSLQRSELTVGQWRSIMGSDPSYRTDCGETCPVEAYSFLDLQAFIQRLNAQSSGVTYRLPTEAEWEYAARAGATGDSYGPIAEVAWCHDSIVHPVGRKLPNAWGLYDVLGNGWEWVSDWFASYPAGAVTDPTGASSPQFSHVLRGGAYYTQCKYVRLSNREFEMNAPIRRGFRLVRTP